MEKRRIVLPDIERFYAGSLHNDIPEYRTVKIAHALVTKGGYTLRMSGYPAIGPQGIIGKGDMGVQTLQALEYVKRTVEAGGATWDDIVHMTFSSRTGKSFIARRFLRACSSSRGMRRAGSCLASRRSA